ncbi:MAG: hypothetical protein KF782_06510 [Labilithrix sp.]|nr:hypothetical protein [Labilithrix sp.]
MESISWRRFAKRAGVASIAVFVATLFATSSCGTGNPLAAEPGEDGVDEPTCATPRAGCPCPSPGTSVACGEKVKGDNDFIWCFEGTRTCQPNGAWGECLDGEVTRKSLPIRTADGSGLGVQALGAPGPCPPGIDACDPYCNVTSDDPIGVDAGPGFVLADGGLTLPVSGAVGPGTFVGAPDGDSQCAGAVNVHGAACAPGGVVDHSVCQQDFRCDVASSTCVWNGGDGYYDPTAGGVDLTIGAACEFAAGVPVIPVCNRGSAPVPPNTVLGVNITNAVEDGCTASYPTADCTVDVGPTGLDPGRCTNVLGCSLGGSSLALVNAGQRDVAEPRCRNNAAAAKIDGAPGCAACGACDTRITGTVYDPSGFQSAGNPYGNNLRLSSIHVYQPAGPLVALSDNPAAGPPACDTCASVASPALAFDYTAPNGTFTLYNAVPGPNQTLVVQSGRWRRQFSVGDVPACSTTAVPEGAARMPRNMADGISVKMPKLAFVLGSKETLECLFRRLGVSDSEFVAPTAANWTTTPKRFHVYRSTGMQTDTAYNPPSTSSGLGSSAPAASLLWQSGGRINAYDAVLGSCDANTGAWNGMSSGTTSDRSRVTAYADQGGRLFVDHWAANGITRAGQAPWNDTAVVATNAPTANMNNWGNEPSKARVLNGNAQQQGLYDFLQANNAMTAFAPPYVQLDQPKMQYLVAGTGVTEFIRGLSTWTAPAPDEWAATPGGNHSLSFSFETPLGAASTCGRVIVNAMHVSASRQPTDTTSASNRFPGACAGFGAGNPGPALTAEEKALAYQLFQLTACVGAPPAPPPTPPPPPTPSSQTFVRDYEGVCPSGHRVQWQLFQWQARVAAGASIEFRAATADDPASLPPAPPPAAPATVSAGTADSINSPALGPLDWQWDRNGAGDPLPISYHLQNDPPGPSQPSRRWLRVYMTLHSNGVVAPLLYQWRQLFSCVPQE